MSRDQTLFSGANLLVAQWETQWIRNLHNPMASMTMRRQSPNLYSSSVGSPLNN
jgi:hypothetical protein